MCGMNAPESFPKEAENQSQRTPIEASEPVNIDDIKLSDKDGDPLGVSLNRPEVSLVADIFGTDFSKSNVSTRYQNLNFG